MSNVFWPPGYYIFRDRIPFFLTLVYFHRSRIPRIVRDYLGYYLAFASMIVTSMAALLYLKGETMSMFSGINWSPASPIEWGLFISVSYLLLYSREIPSFEAVYISFIAALGGGWLYECHGWILNPNIMAFFKVNAVKVFFVEFQLFCLPLVWYLINTRFEYKKSRWLLPLAAFGILFYASTPWIKTWFPYTVGYYAYRWYIRLPTIGFLFALLSGIKGVKKQ